MTAADAIPWVMPGAFSWMNEPTSWSAGPPLEVTTDPGTDYWQRTHYGFRRDNGHFLASRVRGDFLLRVSVDFAPNMQYDQCGALVRADEDAWIKCSVEYENPEMSHLGSVVTTHGYSDWATQEIPSGVHDMTYRVRRVGDDFVVEWASDGSTWHQLRVAHLHDCPDELTVGFYACSPTGPGFVCHAREVTVSTY
jgi:uncharacterized protein